jgi:hypothetical protein
MVIFYCLKFETPPTWRVRSWYLYPPGTGWPSYTPRHRVSFFVAGLRWRYSNPPPHRLCLQLCCLSMDVFYIFHYFGFKPSCYNTEYAVADSRQDVVLHFGVVWEMLGLQLGRFNRMSNATESQLSNSMVYGTMALSKRFVTRSNRLHWTRHPQEDDTNQRDYEIARFTDLGVHNRHQKSNVFAFSSTFSIK